ncbi:MAG: PIN domain-containing protein [Fimbriimonadaceae bacterium]|nr:PIN domain-containing protein [Fimbriimonadaceae bacterium]
MTTPMLVDTNILVYAAGRGEDDPKGARARTVLVENHADLAFSTQVIQETYVNLLKRVGYSVSEARGFLAGLETFPLILVTRPIIYRGIAISDRYQLSFWDSVLVATADEAGCRTLLTEDLQDGLRIGGVTVRNPFVA